jgi:hypothetical protein
MTYGDHDDADDDSDDINKKTWDRLDATFQHDFGPDALIVLRNFFLHSVFFVCHSFFAPSPLIEKLNANVFRPYL